MKNINYLKILKIFVLVLVIVAFGGLFMPYQKSIDEYREGLLKVPSETYIEGIDFKNSDAVDLTVMENFKVYCYAMDNNDGSSWMEGTATINVVITVVLILAIALVLLFAILNKNVLVIIFDVILGLCSLAMNYDIVSRGVLPSDNFTYGISYYLFIVIAILILISTITLIILKKNPKLLERNSSVDTLKLNKILDKLKKYWYIVIIVVIVIIAMIFLLNNKPNNDVNNSDNPGNKTSEVDKKDNNKISDEDFEQFTNGYEKAKFSRFNSFASENGLSGTKIYLKGTLRETEISEADGTKSILGYIIDEDNNEWLICLHVVPIVPEKHYDKYIGKEMYLRGVYHSYSRKEEMPMVILDELLIIETGEAVYGMQKVLEVEN